MKIMFNVEKVHSWFEHFGKATVKFRWYFIAAFIAILVLCMSGMSKLKTNPSAENWLLDDDPLKVATNKFKEIFGNDEYAGILVQCDDIFKPENLRLLRKLSQELHDSVPFAEKVYSLTESEFTEGNHEGVSVFKAIPSPVPTNADTIATIKAKIFAKTSFAKSFVTKDSKQSFISIKFSPFPSDWQDKYEKMPTMLAGKAVMHVINKPEYAVFNPKATGMPVINYEITEAMGKETKKLTMISLLIALLVSALMLRSVRGVILPLLVAISSIIAMIGTLGLINFQFEPTFVTMPAILGIAMSIVYSMHFILFFQRQFNLTGKRKESAAFAVGETAWPVLFTASTTIGAMLTFLFVPIQFIWFVGISTALVVFYSYLFTVLLVPTILSIGKDRKPNIKVIEKDGTKLDKLMGDLSVWVLSKAKPITICFILFFLVIAYGITKIEVTTDWDKSYGRKLTSMDMAISVAESELGSLYSYNLTVEFPDAGAAKDPQNLKKLDELVKEAESFELTKRTTSVLNIIKDFNQVLNADMPEYHAVPESKEMVAQLLNLYETSGGTEAEYWTDYDYKFYRVMVDIKYLNTKISVNEIHKLEAKAKQLFPGATCSVVGMLPQSLLMQDYLVKSQIQSFFYSVLFIGILLMIVFGSVKVGLVALIPNVVPTIAIAGLMGYFKMPLDMITVTIIPMILGLAVDDTIHFFNHSQIEFLKVRNYTEALRRTFISAGVAAVTASLILCANFFVNGFSAVTMLVNMGVLSVAGILMGVIAELTMTPILIKWFKVFGNEDSSVYNSNINQVKESAKQEMIEE